MFDTWCLTMATLLFSLIIMLNFSFPLKKTELLREWVKAVRRECFTPTSTSYLCSDHFTEADFQVKPGAAIRRLNDTAVPSIFSFPEHLQVSEAYIWNINIVRFMLCLPYSLIQVCQRCGPLCNFLWLTCCPDTKRCVHMPMPRPQLLKGWALLL